MSLSAKQTKDAVKSAKNFCGRSLRTHVIEGLFGIPDPAFITIATLLAREDIGLDKSFGICLGLLGLVLLEELI